MPKKMRDKWVKALRSGEYGQCRGVLTNGNGGFCCLGVLQHVTSGGKCEVDDYYNKFRGLPSESWYAKNGIIAPLSAEAELSRMNDGRGWNGEGHKKFSTIATWIEKNVKVY